MSDEPNEITTSQYWIRGGHWTLREALPWDHPENLYNHTKKTYPNLDPEDYGVKKPKNPRIKHVTCPHCKQEMDNEDYDNDFTNRDD